MLHGDSHPGNTYFRDGRAGLLDWQVVRRGHPSRDLTYTLVLGMPTADRRAAERDLLDVYRKALVSPVDRSSTATSCGPGTVRP